MYFLKLIILQTASSVGETLPNKWNLLPVGNCSLEGGTVLFPVGSPRVAQILTQSRISTSAMLFPLAPPSLLSIKWEAWSWRPPPPSPSPGGEHLPSTLQNLVLASTFSPLYPCRIGQLVTCHLAFGLPKAWFKFSCSSRHGCPCRAHPYCHHFLPTGTDLNFTPPLHTTDLPTARVRKSWLKSNTSLVTTLAKTIWCANLSAGSFGYVHFRESQPELLLPEIKFVWTSFAAFVL